MKKGVPALLLSVCAVLSSLLFACRAAQVERAFTDVPAGADYAGAVEWCREQGLIQGTSDTTFSPEETLTRAMAATILYRAAGEPGVGGAPSFADTQEKTWYSDAVVWADDNGIVRGYGNGLFGTNDPVTLEQLDVLLRRYRGEEPVWTGDPALNVPATRAQVAVALYAALTAAPVPELELSKENEEETSVTKIDLTFHGHTYPATLADHSSAQAFVELLRENGGALSVDMSDYGGFEKVGPLGTTLPRNDEQITTSPGDIILYQGNSITVYYAQNSWNFTRLGRLDDPRGLRDALGSGDVTITFSLQ